MLPIPSRGAGLGLRPAHLAEVIRNQPYVPWFEVHICNYLGSELNRALLRRVAAIYPLSFHGVNLNLGGTDPLDREYLRRLKGAIEDIQPALVSDHLCFTAHNGHHFHDLMPLPHTGEAARHVAGRIRQVQDFLERRILVENITRYFNHPENELSEAEFVSEVCQEADCGLLLDLTNAWINQQNLGQDLEQYLNALPLQRVGEVHLAGVGSCDGQLIDSHNRAPDETIWNIYRQFCELRPAVPCLIEWDDQLPPFSQLLQLQARAQSILASSTKETRQLEAAS